MSYEPILEVTRGSVVESVHYGAYAIADSTGNKFNSWGDINAVTYLRSSAKPFQAIALIEAGGVEHFGFKDKQIALMCASHSGSDAHVEVVQSIQDLIAVTEDNLVCGTHPPLDKAAARRLIREEQEPTPNRHNCSGKHSGMLALSVLMGEAVEGYSEPDHPIQKLIKDTISEMFGLKPTDVHMGIDGCSVPTFAVPIHSAATAFARLADPSEFSEKRQQACERIWRAMTSYPEMIAGEGRLDTELMRAFNGSVLSKGGAEGYQGIAIAPGAIGPNSPALGIALKISDGDPSSRARGYLALSILRDVGLIGGEMPTPLVNFGSDLIKNWRGLVVGEMRSIYQWKEFE